MIPPSKENSKSQNEHLKFGKEIISQNKKNTPAEISDGLDRDLGIPVRVRVSPAVVWGVPSLFYSMFAIGFCDCQNGL